GNNKPHHEPAHLSHSDSYDVILMQTSSNAQTLQHKTRQVHSVQSFCFICCGSSRFWRWLTCSLHSCMF
ncbi:hypothetical protein NDU88_005300, partial [Pleurodeles waltl]